MKPNDAGIDTYEKPAIAGVLQSRTVAVTCPTIPPELQKAYCNTFSSQCQDEHDRLQFQCLSTGHRRTTPIVSRAANLHLRTIAAAIQTALLSLRPIWGGSDPSSGTLDCDSNILTVQTRKSSFEEWYPLHDLRIELPTRIIPESSWEVSLSLPTRNTTFIFVLSILMAPTKDDKVVVHLVRKTTFMTIVGFCLVDGETYSKVQEKIEGMICREMRHSEFGNLIKFQDAGGGQRVQME